MVLLHKRKVAAVICTALLATAGVVNYINHTESQTVSLELPQANESYDETTNYGEAKYVSSDLSLEKSRSEAVSLLQSVSENVDADPAKKAEAQGELIRIAKDIEKEALAEQILTEKGFQEVSVFLNSPQATVRLKSDGLTTQELAQIRDTMKNDAKIEPQNLKIIEAK
ncbi:MAG: SpoIIIAH-like family protein [Clostridia bacterium]|nr:SpoIIIAH-like family protein [Clostridia bacterium]